MVSKKIYNGYKNAIIKRISRIRKEIVKNTGIYPNTKMFISPGFSMCRPIVISDIGDSRVYHYSKRDECYRLKDGVLTRVGMVNYK
jgi:hypothetical protein